MRKAKGEEQAKKTIASNTKRTTATVTAQERFAGYERRDVAGEKVAVKKFPPYGMVVIHSPDGKLSEISISSWDTNGNILVYRKPVEKTRVQAIEKEILELEKSLEREG